MNFMISITTKELEIENDLKRKIEFICDFFNTKPTIINGVKTENQ